MTEIKEFGLRPLRALGSIYEPEALGASGPMPRKECGKIDMDKRPLVGIAVIVIKDNRVLLGKRKNAHGSATWAFPGGHLEFKESIEDCATREVFEETGIQIKNLRCGPYTNDIFADEGKHYVTLFVTADYDSGTPMVKEPHKCEKWEWFQWPPDVHPRFLPIKNLLKLNFKLPH